LDISWLSGQHQHEWDETVLAAVGEGEARRSPKAWPQLDSTSGSALLLLERA